MTYILSLATASPEYCFEQRDILKQVIREMNLTLEQQETLKKLYGNSAIEKRRSVLKNFDLLFSNPTSIQRNEIYKVEAPKLAISAARKALEQWGQSPKKITHVISVSCTGMMAPGVEYFLIRDLGLPPDVRRVGINFMGCFGAFNGLAVARAMASENSEHRVLLVCTELCSLHGQVDADSFLANALFADGAAACIVGNEKSEKPLWEIVDHSSLLLENSHHVMSWDVSNSGYVMKLSIKVPVLIKKNITPFVDRLLGQKTTGDMCHWAIHPGGRDIVRAIEDRCALLPWQTACSWEVLKEYGNMSSATFLFVLEKLLETPSDWTLGLAFGPGLAMEGILLRR